MKRFVVRHGAFAGEHMIYDNPEEARRILGNDLKIVDWEYAKHPSDFQKGDWCHLTDGTVAQLLQKTKFQMTQKQAKMFPLLKDSPRYAMRFPFYTAAMWYRKRTDDWGRQRVLGQPSLDSTRMSKTHHTSISSCSKKDDMIAAKLAFANLILRGLSPRDAIRMVLNLYGTDRFNSPQKIYRLRKNFMADELVVATIHNGIAPFKELLAKSFTDKDLVAELEKLLSASRPGTMNHRENLRFIMELTGHIKSEAELKAEKKSAKSEASSAEVVSYEDVPPPPLGK